MSGKLGGIQIKILSLLLCSAVFSWMVGVHGTSVSNPNFDIIKAIEVNHGNTSKSNGYWTYANGPEYYGDLYDVRGNSSALKAFHDFMKKFDLSRRDHKTDFETPYAVEHFFWGQTNGIVLELGAVDGVWMSESLPLEKRLRWHRILVEGDPTRRKVLATQSNSLAYSCAVCQSAQTLHYVAGTGVGGIIEFMDPAFLRWYHPEFVRLPRSAWSTQTNVTQIQCVPLQWIFDYRRIYHVNFFILDVEGAELEVLRSIDYSKVRFDVITVETERKYRPVGYANEVVSYLNHQGYKMIAPPFADTRNTWFVHQFYVPCTRHKR